MCAGRNHETSPSWICTYIITLSLSFELRPRNIGVSLNKIGKIRAKCFIYLSRKERTPRRSLLTVASQQVGKLASEITTLQLARSVMEARWSTNSFTRIHRWAELNEENTDGRPETDVRYPVSWFVASVLSRIQQKHKG